MVDAQALAVVLLVSASAVYAGWSLMPSGLRRRVAAGLLHWPLPGLFKAPLRRAASVAESSCGGCGGCTGKPSALPSTPAIRPLVFHRRSTR